MTAQEAIAEIRAIIRMRLPEAAKVGQIAAVLDEVE